jgi:prepilin-type processing-associated H-X9-DG protein
MRKAIQALIVVLILLSCGGVFTISILKVREAAARAQCNNNCRMIGMSFLAYQENFPRSFPPASIPNPELPAEKRLSWIVSLVPYVEANNLYSRMDKEKSWEAEENRFANEMRLAYLQCPAHPQASSSSPFGPTDYVGISGIGDNAIALLREDSHAGIFGYDWPVKLDELKRGASETTLVVETSQVSGAWTASGRPTTRGLIPNRSAYFDAGGQFGGNHPGGANVIFADGSVRFIDPSIDAAVWEAMATLSGKGNQE